MTIKKHHIYFWPMLVLFAVALIILSLGVPEGEPEWTSEQQTYDSYAVWNSTLVLDNNGVIHYAWQEDTNNDGTYDLYTAQKDIDSDTVTNITQRTSGYDVWAPKMIYDEYANKIYYVWHQYEQDYYNTSLYQIWTAELDLSDNSWSATQRTTSLLFKLNPCFGLDTVNGVLHYAWRVYDGVDDSWDIWTARMSTDGVTIPFVPVQRTDGTMVYDKQNLAVDSETGMIYYFFRGDDGSGIHELYTASMDVDGVIWSGPEEQTYDGNDKTGLNMLLDTANNRLHYTYFQDDWGNYHVCTASMNTDGTDWSAVRRTITGMGYLYWQPHFILEPSDDTIYLAWAETDGNGIYQLWTAYMNSDCSGWSGATKRTDDVYNKGGIKIVSDIPGNNSLYYTWMQYDDSSHFQLWTGTLAWPQAEPEPIPEEEEEEEEPEEEIKGSVNWYLAAGETSDTMDYYILLQNTNETTANVVIEYYTDSVPLRQEIEIEPTSRYTIYVNDIFPEAQVAAKITSDIGIIVEHAEYWDVDGIEWAGGSNSIGLPFTSTVWYLAEGCTEGFETTIYILNPTEDGAEVLITYMLSDGSTVEQSLTIDSYSRAEILTNDVSGIGLDKHFSTKIESTNGVELAVERKMTWDSGGMENIGGHISQGIISPSTTWYFAEGSTQVNFDTFILLQNANSESTDIRAEFMLDDGSIVTKYFTMAPNSRHTIWPNNIMNSAGEYELENEAISTKIISSLPVIGERSMYWPAGGVEWADGHCAIGVTAPATKWCFAEGATLGSFQMFLLIQNPSNTDTQVLVTFSAEDGTTETQLINVGATSRYTMWVNQIIPDRAISVQVESINGVNIIVDRAMYWTPNSFGITLLSDYDVPEDAWIGGHCSIGMTY